MISSSTGRRVSEARSPPTCPGSPPAGVLAQAPRQLVRNRREERRQLAIRRDVGAHVLAFVPKVVAHDDESDVGGGSSGGGRLRIVDLDDLHGSGGKGGAQTIEGADVGRRPDIRGAAVAHVGGRGEAADQGDRSDRGAFERQHGLSVHPVVLQQHHRTRRDLPGKGPRLVVGDHGRCGVLPGARGVGAELRLDQSDPRALDHGPRGLPRVELPAQVLGAAVTERLLEVHPRIERLGAVAQAPDEIGPGHPLPTPVVAQHRGQEVRVLATPLAVDRVVRRHDGRHALLGDAVEMGQVDVVEGGLVDRDVDREAGVLHGVHGVVLDARHDPSLRAAGQRGAELAQVVRIVPVRLLDAAPGRVAGQVDADAAEEVAAEGADLAADDVPDLFLQRDVPGRAARHRDGERGGCAGDAAAGPVDETGARQPQAIHRTVHDRRAVVALGAEYGQALPEVDVAVEQPEPLAVVESGVEIPGDIARGPARPDRSHGILKCSQRCRAFRVPHTRRRTGAGQ